MIVYSCVQIVSVMEEICGFQKTFFFRINHEKLSRMQDFSCKQIQLSFI